MFKKITIIFAGVFIVTLIAFFVVKIVSREDTVPEQEVLVTTPTTEGVEESTPTETEETPEEGNPNAKIRKIVDSKNGPIRGITLNNSTAQVLYYQNKNMLVVDFRGGVRSSVGGYPFVAISDFSWNEKKEKALVRDQEKYYVYNLNQDEIVQLDEKIDIATWASNDRIVYKFYQEGERKIATADFNGNNERILVDKLKYKKINFAIPRIGEKVCYFRYPDANVEAGLNCVSLKDGSDNNLHQGSFGVNYLWSKNGQRILTSYTEERVGNKMVLGIMNSKGGEFRGLTFPTTVEKCAWSKDNTRIYCALMGQAGEDVILPNDWSSGKYEVTDTFWEIDLSSGKKRRLLESNEMEFEVDAEKLFLDLGENFLFFTDKKTGSVFSVSLN